MSEAAPSAETPRYKRAMDLAVLAAAHIAALPLWALLWVAIPVLIVLDDGRPVFYRQRRVGKDGALFEVLKFRTMTRGSDEDGPARTARDDPRVTRFGRLLRRTALDELPQVLNILRGEMSFVGPRALSAAECAELAERLPDFVQRQAVLPGLTGLAQVYNTGDDPERKLAYDLDYVRRRSPLLDAKLLALSAANTLRGRWDRRS